MRNTQLTMHWHSQAVVSTTAIRDRRRVMRVAGLFSLRRGRRRVRVKPNRRSPAALKPSSSKK